ncbi:origin of replication complex subunit 5 isoform X2 [Cicer arietinum]|uniref:Origin of replication complex subunit 5 isoform X2 n=1 Tax=Cicer arietinum TaxID=3827 RepID=A0A1S2XRC6_CICAR|nr:origin of replication complex subunit 5 isoform X2 [Cicer arietinum]
MDKEEEAPQIPRRTTRSLYSSSASTSNIVPAAKVSNLEALTINDLLVGGDPISLDDITSSFPGRSSQIHEVVRLLGPLNSPLLPLFVYGGASTGKTSIILQIFRHLKRPLVYSSCRTCYNQRILFESVLNQLLLHRKNMANSYTNAKRCERPSDFVNFLREALTGIVNNLKEKSEKLISEKKTHDGGMGNMIYLVFDNFHLVREWDKSSTILPLLFNLYDMLKIPEVSLIFISSTSPDTFYSNMGYVEPIPIYFPDYTEGDIRQILLRNQANQKLYSSFLDVALKPFCRITRQVGELATALKPLYEQYCEPLSDKGKGVLPSEDMKRRLFNHIKPHIASSLNDVFKVSSPSSREVETSKETKLKGNPKRSEEIADLDFHMSTSAKYLLISAFLASRNPATLDASLFDSKGGSDNRKRKRKASEKALEKKELLEEELLMKGPGTFPLERLIAIFQCIVSVADEPSDEDEQNNEELGAQCGNGSLMSDVLLQLSTLCNANFIFKGKSCPIEGSTRYRSTISENMALKVARSLKFPLSKYLYRS